ncbi:MAG TPA: S-layer homology domain-containing protein, partial [Gaiellaceae bacterium]
MGRGLIAVVALLLVPVGAAVAATVHPARPWATPEIQIVTSAGLMGATSPATFRPNAPLTAQALENLVWGLSQTLLQPGQLAPPAPP